MEAQGIDLQITPTENVTKMTDKFTNDQFLSAVGVEASRQAVSFINEYKEGVLVSYYFCIFLKILYE